MKKLSSLLIFAFFLHCMGILNLKGYAQPSSTAVDSVLTRYKNTTNTLTANEFQDLVDLAYDYSDYLHFEACSKLLTFLLTYCQGNDLQESALYHVQGYNHARQRKNRLAVEDYLKSAVYRRNAGEYLLLYKTLTNLGKVYYDMGQYVNAINTYKEALGVANQIDNKSGKALALSGIAIVLSDQKKYKEALQYLDESTENYRLIADSISIGRNYFDIGEIKYLMKEPDAALEYFNLAASIGQKYKDELVISYSLHRIGSIYLDQKKFIEAERYFLQGLELREKIDYPLEIALSHLDLAQLFFLTQHNEKALTHAYKVRELAQKTDFLKGQYQAAELLSNIYEKQSNYAEALAFLKESKQLNDSLFSVEKNQQIENLNTEILIEKNTSVLNLKYAKQKSEFILLIFILGGITLGITAYFLRLKARNKRKHEYQIKQQETEAEKQTILGIYEERKRISRDVHDDLGSSISGIKMLSEMIYDQTKDSTLKQSHAKLLEMQTEVTEKVRDIIWMLNEENNTLEKLVWYCRLYSEKIMESFDVKITSTTNDHIPVVELTDEIRKNFFLCVKEALNNILKHAKASRVKLLFSYENDTFSIHIYDNGKGFDPSAIKSFKNGIENMKTRMLAMEGNFEIHSDSKGTCVIFSKYIPQKGT